MIPHPAGVYPDIDDVAVVDQAVDESGGHDLVDDQQRGMVEHAHPAREVAGGLEPAVVAEHDLGFQELLDSLGRGGHENGDEFGLIRATMLLERASTYSRIRVRHQPANSTGIEHLTD